MRVALAALCAIALASAAVFIAFSESTIAVRRDALREFDSHAREVTDAMSELRVGQQAYVAAGQGTEFWMPKVDATTATAASGLAGLQQAALGADARAALDAAAGSLAEFGEVDRRIRGYLKSGAQLMAADIVFSEGGEAAAAAA